MATKERAIIEGLLMIADKEGNDVPFILNSAQSALDDSFTGRDIIPKARQEGISSYYIARALAKCLSTRNVNAVIVAHEDKATKKMLKKAHYMVENMRGPKPVIKNKSANEITFSKMNSSLSIGTAGSANVGVGDTIHFLHCSEVALWDDPKSLLTGLFQAVPKNGEIGMESTGRGQGNYYHRAVMRAASGNSRYRLHFFNWHEFKEYTYHLSPEQEQKILDNLMPEWEEDKLIEQWGLTAGQLAWRRDKIEELDYDLTKFKQEYPMTLDECFQATGRSVFSTVNYKKVDSWEQVEPNLWILGGHPRPDYTYAIGGDVGGGVGQDNSVAEIICLNTFEQVGEFIDNRIAPDNFGRKLKYLGHMFNTAFITPENNNHGILTIDVLRKKDSETEEPAYPRHMIYRKVKPGTGSREEVDVITDFGFRTSVKSKPFAVGKFRMIVRKELLIHSPFLKDEMGSFIENENGTMSADTGCMDDSVMAMSMCIVGVDKALMRMSRQQEQYESEKLYNDPFTLESIIHELHNRVGEGFPIADQVSDEGDPFENSISI